MPRQSRRRFNFAIHFSLGIRALGFAIDDAVICCGLSTRLRRQTRRGKEWHTIDLVCFA